MAKKSTYQKPKIIEKKIEVSFFLKNRFLDSAVATLVPPVFAQSSCSGPCQFACSLGHLVGYGAGNGGSCAVCGIGLCECGEGVCSGGGTLCMGPSCDDVAP